MSQGVNCNLWKFAAGVAVALPFFGAVAPQRADAASAGVYGSERFFTMNAADTAGIRASGMSSLFLFAMSVNPNGDFYYGGHVLCQNGAYTGDAGWRSRIDGCRTLPTGVNRIEMAIGGWGSPTFHNIKDRIAADGTGTNTVLYRNLSALKNALGINAIQFDDETTYDVGSASAFGNMVAAVGMKVTLCPYTNAGYWQSVKAQLGAKVDAVYLQCYDGGAANNPASWNNLFGGLKVQVGYWERERDATFQTKMLNLGRANGCTGGFLWTDDVVDTSSELLKYSDWIHTSLDNNGTSTNVILNRATLMALDASGAGTVNGTPLIQSTLHGGSNQQWISTYSGGQGSFIGVGSGRAATVDGYQYGDNVGVSLWDNIGALHQKYTVQYQGAGFYSIVFAHSGKAMQVQNASTASGARVVQYTLNANGYNAQWAFRCP
jgi:hypothetical protein